MYCPKRKRQCVESQYSSLCQALKVQAFCQRYLKPCVKLRYEDPLLPYGGADPRDGKNKSIYFFYFWCHKNIFFNF